VPPQPPAGLPSALLERRPDVRAREQQLAAASARIGARAPSSCRRVADRQLRLRERRARRSAEEPVAHLVDRPASRSRCSTADAWRAQTDQAIAAHREAQGAYRGRRRGCIQGRLPTRLANLRAAQGSQDDLARADRPRRMHSSSPRHATDAGYSATWTTSMRSAPLRRRSSIWCATGRRSSRRAWIYSARSAVDGRLRR
jgi:hypothetical protein